MNILRTYLWKEWREQRAVLGILALGLLLVTAILSVALPTEFLEVALAYDWVVGMCLIAVLITVGSDLLPRDLRREPLQFLERAPAGLGVAFRGKLAFFLAGMLAAGLFGFLLAEGTALFTTGEAPGLFFGGSHAGMTLILGTVLILWVFAASAWVTTSAMAVPSAVVFLLVAGWPGWLVAREVEGFRPDGYFSLCLIGPVVGALVSARWSFVVGAVRSRSRRALVLGGVGIGVLSFVPSWAWAGWRYFEWVNPPSEILRGFVGRGGRFAFLTIRPIWNQRSSFAYSPDGRRSDALLLDLRDGSWSREGKRGESSFQPDMRLYRRKLGHVSDAVPFLDVPYLEEAHSGAIYDSATGLRMGEDTNVEELWTGLGPRDFGLEEETPVLWITRAGLGHRLVADWGSDGEQRLLRVAATGLVVDQATITPNDSLGRFARVWILPERWLVHEEEHRTWYDPSSGRRRVHEWSRWSWCDPSSGEREPFEELKEGERITATVDDGSLLVVSGGSLVHLDPVTGKRHSLSLQGETQDLVWVSSPGLRPDGRGMPVPAGSRTLVQLSLERGGSSLALLDLAAGTLRLPPPAWGFTASIRHDLLCIDGPRAIAIEGAVRIVRYDFDAETREVIFDVSQL